MTGTADAMRRIIAATDGSSGANRAVDTAARLAKALSTDLVILTVGGSITGAELRRLAGIGGDVAATLKSASNRVLKQAQKRAQHLGIAAPKLENGWGDPAETIIDIVRSEKATMLVVGRRGRGRLSGLLLGSVSQKVASLAPCIVIVVP
jgi:nucleotide-binding universal stress UspA family protein